MNMAGSHTTLVATLGGQPQIITNMLDLLLQRDEPIGQVIVVYPGNNLRYRSAFRRLMGEFISDSYDGRPIHLRGVPVGTPESDMAEFITPNDVSQVHKIFYDLIRDLKAEGQHVHLCLSGGRRILALIALGAAMQYLTPVDKLWNLYTPPALKAQANEGAIMHFPPSSGLRLIEVPFVAWTSYFPELVRVLGLSPAAQREAELGFLSPEERTLCEQVWEGLPVRAQQVLRCVAEGMTRAQTARHLSISPYTFDTYRTKIIARCAQAWDVDERMVDGKFLRRFDRFIKGLDQV
jgi:CRISPR-associated protein Csx14